VEQEVAVLVLVHKVQVQDHQCQVAEAKDTDTVVKEVAMSSMCLKKKLQHSKDLSSLDSTNKDACKHSLHAIEMKSLPPISCLNKLLKMMTML
jgi:hypothetical protein